jgi:hypothetical protein
MTYCTSQNELRVQEAAGKFVANPPTRLTLLSQFGAPKKCGPVAAIDAAVHYLDALHWCDHVGKIQSEVAER